MQNQLTMHNYVRVHQVGVSASGLADKRVVRLAFNLYTDGKTLSVYDYKHKDEQIDECREYSECVNKSL